ncbi:glycosyltransferase [Vibrio alfacsensis]|uniref:glycosyltransferase n=1 Tax=Vibrio alfacsensis TaxID=1074311 RepID=UPI00406888BE
MCNNIQICVFAHNLERTIKKSIISLINACDNYEYEMFILVNGCSDNTFNVVYNLSKENKRIKPINLSIGDKSNAWNEFVFNYYKQGSISVFVDGDLLFGENAIKKIVDFHLLNPHYNSISSFPCINGRSSQIWREKLLKEHQFTGNMYLLSPHFISRLIDNNVKLPIGLIGDDSMLGYLSATDICSDSDLPSLRIGVCQEAVFIYESLNPFNIHDQRLYIRRKIRYSLRHFQQVSIVGALKETGISAMPTHAAKKTRIPLSKIRWLSSNLIFDLIAKVVTARHKNFLTHQT